MTHPAYQACIEACHACADACEHCAGACLDETDIAMLARCISLDMDCAQLCRTTASFLARGSEFAPMMSQLCAEACERCGLECTAHQHDHCQACAAACERCAQACRDVERMQVGSDAAGVGSGVHAH